MIEHLDQEQKTHLQEMLGMMMKTIKIEKNQLGTIHLNRIEEMITAQGIYI